MATNNKNSEEILDTNKMILAAKGLQRIAQRMEEELAESDSLANWGEFLATPVLLTLATEIALKALKCQERNGPHLRSHDLLELFDDLGTATQKRLETKMPRTADPLLELTNRFSRWPTVRPGIKETLCYHRKAFEDWRYSYENPEAEDTFYATGFSKALTAIIEVYDETAEKMRNK